MKRNKWKYSLVITGLLLSLWLLQSGYTVFTLPDLTRVTWDSSQNPIEWKIWDGFLASLPQIKDGSNPQVALRSALDVWVQRSSVSIIAPETTEDTVGQDERNVITVADNTTNRNAAGKVLGRAIFYISGSSLVEADVIFNPGSMWSTMESNDLNDENLFHVAVHEFGHGLNLGHTINRSSTMFTMTSGFTYDFNQPSWDDIAGILGGYPLPGMSEITGTISGRVTRDGSPVFGAFVVAVDEQGVLVASAISMPDGSYQLEFLPPGDYTLYVEPLDGPMTPGDVAAGIFSSAPMVTDFLPKFYNDSMLPSVPVASDTTGIDFEVTQGDAAIDPTLMSTATNLSGGVPVFSSPGEAFQGVDTNFVVAGKGVDQLLPNQGLSFLGSSVTAGNLLSQGKLTNGDPFAIFPLRVPLSTPAGEYPVILRKNRETGIITGGLTIFSPLRFLQSFAQYVHVPGTFSSSVFLINKNLSKAVSGKISARSESGDRTGITLGSLGKGASNDLDFALSAGGSLSVKSGGSTFVGSVRARGDRDIGGTVLLTSASGTTGGGNSRPLYYFIAPLLLDVPGGENTGMAITTLDDRPVKIFIQVQDKNGKAVASTTVDIAANGRIAKFIREWLSAVPTKFTGTVLVTANRPVGATIIRTTPGVFTTFPVIQNRVATRSFYAHFAHAPAAELSSELLLVNPSPVSEARVKIQVRSKEGAPASVTLSGKSLPTGMKTETIPPLGCVTLKTEGSGTLVGSVEISSDRSDNGNGIPVGGVVLFSSPAVGTAGVGESFPLSNMVLAIERDISKGTDTGIAVVNTKDQSVTLVLTARDSTGAVVAGPKEIFLAARNQLARFPNEEPLGLNLPNTFTGSLWIEVKEAGCRVALTAIRQSPGVLTTFPAISLEYAITPSD